MQTCSNAAPRKQTIDLPAVDVQRASLGKEADRVEGKSHAIMGCGLVLKNR